MSNEQALRALPCVATDEMIAAGEKAACKEDLRWNDLNADEVWAAMVKAAPALTAHARPVDEATPSSRWSANGEPDPHGSRYTCERAELAMGDLTDDELANAVFLHGGESIDIAKLARDPGYIPGTAFLTAAKDRIRWLSRQVAALQPAQATPAAVDALRAQLEAKHDALLRAYDERDGLADRVEAQDALIAKQAAALAAPHAQDTAPRGGGEAVCELCGEHGDTHKEGCPREYLTALRGTDAPPAAQASDTGRGEAVGALSAGLGAVMQHQNGEFKPMQASEGADSLPAVLFDGYRVWTALPEPTQRKCGDSILVCAVLDAVVNLARADAARATQEPSR